VAKNMKHPRDHFRVSEDPICSARSNFDSAFRFQQPDGNAGIFVRGPA
jgi:hypothetical protein